MYNVITIRKCSLTIQYRSHPVGHIPIEKEIVMAEKKRIDWKSLGLVKGKDGLVTFNGLNPMDVLPENSIAYATSYGVYAMMTRRRPDPKTTR